MRLYFLISRKLPDQCHEFNSSCQGIPCLRRFCLSLKYSNAVRWEFDIGLGWQVWSIDNSGEIQKQDAVRRNNVIPRKKLYDWKE